MASEAEPRTSDEGASESAPGSAPGSEPELPGSHLPLWRRLLPFVIAAGLIAFVLSRIDWHSFVTHIKSVNYPGLVAFMAVFLVSLLSADVLATTYVYRFAVGRVSYRELFIVRGASYLPALVNHHLGQGWITYFLSRTYRVPLGRVAGGTLVAYATWGGCLLALGCVSLLAAGLAEAWLAIPLGLGIAYLILLALKPTKLANNRVLAPLFEAGVTGHIVAMALRVPHMAVLFVGTWVPFYFFGVDIPVTAALTYVPIVMVAVTLPIAPQGLGTRDALAGAFFYSYVVGGPATEEYRRGVVAAATVTTAVLIVLIGVVIGLSLLRPATRLMHSRRHGQQARDGAANSAGRP